MKSDVKYKHLWREKEIETLSREELLEALNFYLSEHHRYLKFAESERNRDLLKEIEIKDGIIEKALKR